MKKSLLIAAFALGTYMVSAQAPEKMSYQAVVRNATGQLIQNQNVGIKASVLQNSATGAVVYSETLSGTTNAIGLVSLAIGSGTILSGTFASIDWSTGNYYLKTETDPTGGTNYTIAGTSQLLSVPYAMYAKTSGSGSGSGTGWSLAGNTVTDADFIGTINDKPLKFKINNLDAGVISKSNTSFGYNTLTVIGNGNGNSAFGQNALKKNTDGSNNTAFGSAALFANTEGNDNVATGSGALLSNTTGSNNVATGSNTLVNNNGNYNIATGSNALRSNTDGSNNIAMGTNALYANTAGIQNIAIGANALSVNTAGNYNVATGTEALNKNIGHGNVAIGHKSLITNSTGEYNAAIGLGAMFNNITGTSNTALGTAALESNLYGSRNVAIGNDADVLTNNLSNATAIGYFAKVSASNKIRLGNNDVTVIEGQVPFSNVSDERFKYDIKNNVPGLVFIKKLKPVTYYMDTEKMGSFLKTGTITNSKSTTSSNKQMNTGFLAQEVAKTAAELGYSFDGVHAPTNDKDYYSIAYSQFVMPLVKAVQEQQVMIETLEKRIEELEKK